MRKRRLGKTEIEVSELSLGTWGLSGDGYGPVAEAEVDRVIDRALELGIDTFETADVYGRGAMERRLGARLPPATTHVVTKIGTDRDVDPPRKRFDLDHLRPAFERSRERLARDKIDVVLLHNPSEHAMEATEPFDFLKELKRLGALRAWGVSAGSAAVVRAAVERGADVMEPPTTSSRPAICTSSPAPSTTRARPCSRGACSRTACSPDSGARTASSIRATTAAIAGSRASSAAASASSTPSARS